MPFSACIGPHLAQTPSFAAPPLTALHWIFIGVNRRDRMSTPRGPCSLPVLREAWVNGIIDESTLVWGQGLADWLPVRNVRTLVPQIRTVEGERWGDSLRGGLPYWARSAAGVARNFSEWHCHYRAHVPLHCGRVVSWHRSPLRVNSRIRKSWVIFCQIACCTSTIAPLALLLMFTLRLWPAVQVATWIKKTFALKPALEQVRKQRAATRTEKSSQVSSMY